MSDTNDFVQPDVKPPSSEDAIALVQRWGKPDEKKIPDGYKSEADFLSSMRTVYDLDLGADLLNRNAAVEDAAFVSGDQWDDTAKGMRVATRKPVLTINRLPAFIGQLVGNRRMNETSPKVVPDRGGTKEIAKIREGLIRSILKNTTATSAFDNAFQNQVIGGIGNFQLRIDWADDDVFDQDINVVAIPNPLAVVWDRTSIEPTGADAGHCFVIDSIPNALFKETWPDATAADVTTDSAFSGAAQSAFASGWFLQDMVRVVNYWRMVREKRTLALMQNGNVEDVTNRPVEEWAAQVVIDKRGMPVMREGYRRFAEMYVCTGLEILEGPFRYAISRIPVYRVQGWEVNVGEDRRRWGLVRFAKDPMRLHNYWRSVIAERLMLAPKARWVAADTAVQGREAQWRNAHLSDDPLLIYNADSGAPPQLTPPVQIEPALVEEASMAVQDIRDVTNMHEASLGMNGNEVSGKAINARVRSAEVGTVIYNDNLNMAIEACGGTCNELVPIVYSNERTVKILGEDMSAELVQINSNQNNDITVGKYSVTIMTGPSYVTKRLEAAEGMLNMVNAMPATMEVAADKIVEAQDWPGSEEIARRLRTRLPHGTIAEKDMDEESKVAMAQQQQAAQAQQQMQQAMFNAELAEKQAKAEEAQARARLALAQAELQDALTDKAFAEAGLTRVKADLAPKELAIEARSTAFNDRLKAVDAAHPEPKPRPQPKVPSNGPSKAGA